MIINIRGTNGSGKTSLVRALMGKYNHKPIRMPNNKIGAYLLETTPQIRVIGSYENVCGGCDGIKTQDESKERILTAAQYGDVVFEGVLISTIFGPWLEFSRQNGGMVWAFLDTPLEECLRRIQIRNGGRPVKEDQVASKHQGMQRIAAKARAAGERVVDLPWQDPLPALLALWSKQEDF